MLFLLHWSARTLKPWCELIISSQFCWETSGPSNHVDATWHTTPSHTAIDQEHLLMATALLIASGPPSRTVCPDTPQKLLRNSLRNNKNKSPRHWPGLQVPQMPIQSSICGTCWIKCDPGRPLPPTYRHTYGPGARHPRTPPEVLWPCLYRSELFWLYKGNLHIIVLWLNWCIFPLVGPGVETKIRCLIYVTRCFFFCPCLYLPVCTIKTRDRQMLFNGWQTLG